MPAPRLLLLTDSHGACIAAAAAAAGIPAVGKPLAGGRLLNRQFHEFDGRDIRFSDSLADARYRAALNELGVPCASEISCPVLCTLGGNFHFLARGEAWDGFAIPGSDQAGQFLSQSAFEATVQAMISGALQIYSDLNELKLDVLFALPPRRWPETASAEAFLAIEAVVPNMIAKTGARVVDVRDVTLASNGQLAAPFRHPDPGDATHGSTAFGVAVIERALALLAA